MISQNEFCGAEQIATSHLRCLLYLLEEWTGVECLEEYPNYLITCLLVPLFIAFLLPAVIFILVFICAIIVHIYKRKTDTQGYMNGFWKGVRQLLATVWYVHARIWNGKHPTILLMHESCELNEGSAMIVNYHGATFLDFVYLVAIVLIRKKKILHIVAGHHYVFSIPGIQLLMNVFLLENGGLVIISPAGVREALLSNENYTLMWRNRKRFAQVAIEAKVPIIPTFTQNIRGKLFRLIYEYLCLPIYLLYGNLPVKLQTYFGDPIPYDPNITAEELAEKAKNALQLLIEKHQKIPGNRNKTMNNFGKSL
uniref:Phospholipid/glycerol acyltransferase domain-containing protein n=1 Tax=Naja naja TaxID=35670 RepID=A0A8C6YAU3_NAJNA